MRAVNRTLRRKYCHPYSAHGQKGNKKTGKDVKPEVCRSILGDELLFATPAEQDWRENLFVTYSIRFSRKRRNVRKCFFHFARNLNTVRGVLLGILDGSVLLGSPNSDPILDKKNVIFLTTFQTWPLRNDVIIT